MLLGDSLNRALGSRLAEILNDALSLLWPGYRPLLGFYSGGGDGVTETSGFEVGGGEWSSEENCVAWVEFSRSIVGNYFDGWMSVDKNDALRSRFANVFCI